MAQVTGSTLVSAFWDDTDRVAFNPYNATGTYTLKRGHLYVSLTLGRGGSLTAPGSTTHSGSGAAWASPVGGGSAGGNVWVGIHSFYNTGADLTSQTISHSFGQDALGAGFMVAEFTNTQAALNAGDKVWTQGVSNGLISAETSLTINYDTATRTPFLCVSICGSSIGTAITGDSDWANTIGSVTGTGPNASFIGQWSLSPVTGNSATFTFASNSNTVGCVAEYVHNGYPKVIES